ncbi:MAG TPA: DUF4153 domain-containing protein [Planctomycetaceae bacterium]|nr:DUF4153 domain-containing protein [Planctomycetaceae bacterium]
MDDPTPPTFSPDLISPTATAIASVDPTESPPRLWEIASLVEIMILADLAIYRGEGVAYAGWAALLALMPVLLYLGSARRRPRRSVFLLGTMLVVLAARLLWCGSLVEKAVGLALLPCFALAAAGYTPYLNEALSFTLQIPYHGGRGLIAYGRGLLHFGRRFAPSTAIAIVLPVVIGAAFSLLFVLANPDLVKSVSETLSHVLEQFRNGMLEFSLGESVFLACVGWITVALLRARVTAPQRSLVSRNSAVPSFAQQADAAPRPLYLAWRNSLALVVLIYAVYLVFEFQTLWFRQFPKGFYYSGYAHEGAAWLTIALGLATSILSLIFRGRILTDSRVNRLQRLAWIWSAENLVLAAAVYNRLFIYVGFNGMTPMRILGFYGVSAVVVGFLLVVVKILRGHSLAWLLQRHLWTLGFAIYLYAITPLDYLSMRYNVARILAGDSAPSVQITEHFISSEGLLALFPLLDSSDVVVKTGVRALLDRRRDETEDERAATEHWTAYQIADRLFLDRMNRLPASTARFPDEETRQAAWIRFKTVAYQWY